MVPDLVHLSGVLVLSALLLFFVTTLAGRLWCGHACPQSVCTELFQWLELRIGGDHLARQRLDARPWDATKLLRRGGRHLAWALLALATGFSFVARFTPARELAAALPRGRLGPWDTFWILAYAGLTWLNAGVLREKVCQHMCPYGRFQGALMDAQTLIVGYDLRRGEPRGARPRGSDAAARSQGACVDCTLCVQVCPVGIDIRQGLQAACIACGLCIDACDRVMDQLRAPRGLIRMDTPQGFAGLPAGSGHHGQPTRFGLAGPRQRPRPWIYGGLLLGGGLAMAWSLASRPVPRVDVLRDRSALARPAADGGLDNLYRVQVVNASAQPQTVRVRLGGDAAPQGSTRMPLQLQAPAPLQLAPGAQGQWILSVHQPAEARMGAATGTGTPPRDAADAVPGTRGDTPSCISTRPRPVSLPLTFELQAEPVGAPQTGHAPRHLSRVPTTFVASR